MLLIIDLILFLTRSLIELPYTAWREFRAHGIALSFARWKSGWVRAGPSA